jgi:hypothetical protein
LILKIIIFYFNNRNKKKVTCWILKTQKKILRNLDFTIWKMICIQVWSLPLNKNQAWECQLTEVRKEEEVLDINSIKLNIHHWIKLQFKRKAYSQLMLMVRAHSILFMITTIQDWINTIIIIQKEKIMRSSAN